MKNHLDQVMSRVLLIRFANNVIFALYKASRVASVANQTWTLHNLDHDAREIIPLLQGTEKISKDILPETTEKRRNLQNRRSKLEKLSTKSLPQQTVSIRRRNGVVYWQNLNSKSVGHVPKGRSVGGNIWNRNQPAWFKSLKGST